MSKNLYCTKNDCYKNNAKLKSVSYLIVHTPAVYPVIIRAESGSGGGWFQRWNRPGVEKLVHGFIDDTGVYEFAPPTLACWQVGDSWGNANCIGYELCELGTRAEFDKVWSNAVNHYTSLCKKYGLTADKVVGHCEAHNKGFASNHSDPDPYFRRFGKSMKDFRADVKKALSGADTGAQSAPAPEKAYNPPAYARVCNVPIGDLLNVRSGPGTSYGVIRQLANSNEVDVLEILSNGWAKINIVDRQGYVNASYLSIVAMQSAKQIATVTGCKTLNIRKTPNGAILTTVSAGAVLDIIGSGEDPDGDTWTKVQHGSLTGYVWPKYIK